MSGLPTGVPCSDTTVEVAGLRLAVRIWGDEAKPPVLLQHGLKDTGASWDWTVATLVDRYCLVVPELRGHGRSAHVPGGGYGDDDYLADFAAVNEWAEGRWPGPIALVGHSAGGNVALRYAAAFPQRVSRLCVIEGLGFSQEAYDRVTAAPWAARLRKETEARLARGRRPRRVFADEEEAIARFGALHPRLSAAQARHLAKAALRRGPEGWTWRHDPLVAFATVRPTPPADYLPLYAAIRCPVLLAYGTDSWASDPEADGRMAAFGEVSLRRYAGAGHWPHQDQPDAFGADLRRFLEKGAAAGR
ncbi:alpha/beta fold hydrolase [Parvularcula dongshanensis]|uniref:Pimeloyl-ACP methyl ester carboxylesterase n=1 Tax=Parvularcula dongshanensis TaxID=1173995 RepID=A0A840I256_9PROT|nr:alpha/beta hydrolase [Parvularcula dongshanensis]MBB4658371.1 pimeloyl-ACP methyl ester carboxylesterase [Parvularcula dongshanensis]